MGSSRNRIIQNHKLNILQKFKRKISLYTYSSLEKWCYSSGLIPNDHLCLPDFLVIGAQKAGTTWLYENLRCHQELFLPEPKELHYFDQYFHRSIRYYANLFEQGRSKVKGEITPNYSVLSKKLIRFIYKVMPDVKLIFIMRNPIYRSWSHAVMNLTAVTSKRDISEVTDFEFKSFLKSEANLKFSNYSNILDNWLSIFPREQFYICFYEDIANQPEKFLYNIFSHIGVSTSVSWDNFPLKQVIKPIGNDKNKSTSLMRPEIKLFLEQMYSSDINNLHHRFGKPIEKWFCGDS